MSPSRRSRAAQQTRDVSSPTAGGRRRTTNAADSTSSRRPAAQGPAPAGRGGQAPPDTQAPGPFVYPNAHHTSRELERARELLADGAWHDYKDVVDELAKLVPPGKATRNAERLRQYAMGKRRRDGARVDPEGDQSRIRNQDTDRIKLAGARAIARKVLGGGRFEIYPPGRAANKRVRWVGPAEVSARGPGQPGTQTGADPAGQPRAGGSGQPTAGRAGRGGTGQSGRARTAARSGAGRSARRS